MPQKLSDYDQEIPQSHIADLEKSHITRNDIKGWIESNFSKRLYVFFIPHVRFLKSGPVHYIFWEIALTITDV